MVLKQNIKNQIIASGFIWTTTIVLFIGWWYVNFDRDYFLVVGICQIVLISPALYLHFEYYLRNRGETIEINSNEILIFNNDKEKRYPISQLEKIIVYQSANIDRFGIPLTAMDYYRFARIITKSNEEIIITCFMIRKLENVVQQLNGINYERKKGFCTTFWY